MRAELFFDAGAILAEGPLWCRERGELLWVDILAGEVHRTAADGCTDHVIEIGEHVGAVALTQSGGLVAACRSGFRLVGEGNQHPLLAELPTERNGPAVRMNDGKCDAAGRFLAGTMAYDETPRAGKLWSFDGERMTCLLNGVTISNGLAWSIDGSQFFYVDTPTQRIDVFEYDLGTGEPGRRQSSINIPMEDGAPDGITVDAEGGIWVALWEGAGVHRYVDGKVDERIDVPARRVTSCAFGGVDLRTLFITTADGPDGGGGSIFAVDPGVVGTPSHRFQLKDERS